LNGVLSIIAVLKYNNICNYSIENWGLQEIGCAPEKEFLDAALAITKQAASASAWKNHCP
jgi:hypothetical protein